MKKYDFLILYELKNREFDNICLIKYELESRGYTVLIQNTLLSNKRPAKVEAEVILMPWLVSTNHVMIASTYVKKIHKIVNLQWEQVFRKGVQQNKNSTRYNFEGLAKHAIHIAWGQRNFDRLVNDCGILPEHVYKTGDITFDFLRPEFKSFYMTREDLFREFSIDPEMKVCLFISSFSYVEMSADRVAKSTQLQNVNLTEFQKISIQSQDFILEWFRKVLSEMHDILIVYRPHPSEKISDKVDSLERQFSNFKVIRDYSVAQWFVTCDLVLNWYSTALAQILASGKQNYLLRPVEIPDELDLSILKSKECFINTFDQFRDIFVNQTGLLKASDTFLSEYYVIDPKIPNYKTLCDFLLEVFESPRFEFADDEELNRYKKIPLTVKLRNEMTKLEKSILILMHHTGLKKNTSKWFKKKLYNEHLAEINSVSEDEIEINMERIRKAFNMKG